MGDYIFWLSLFILIYIYLGYLLISIILGNVFARPLIKKDILPAVSMIIPAFNEERVIKEKLDNMLELDYPKERLEIIVVSESIDQTNDIVREYSKKNVALYTYETRRGKSMMIYDTVPKAKGEIIVFSDANAIYEKDALRKLVRNFHDKTIGAAMGKLVITNPQDSSISKGESIYKKYEGLLRKYNSRLHSILGADGSMFALRRELYFPISPERGDDFELAVRILLKGFGVVFEPEAISYEKACVYCRDEIKRKIRIVSWFLKSSFILLTEALVSLRILLVFQLVSNKILRWMSPYFLILLLFSSYTLYNNHFLYRLFFFGQAAFYLAAVTGGIYALENNNRLVRLLRLPFYFLTFNYAFLLGTLRGLFIKQRSLWDKVR